MPVADVSAPPALPSRELLAAQAAWLAPARGRLLRQVAIARRRSVLELGAGHGAVTGELVRRSGGHVVALDPVWAALRGSAGLPVGGDARRLPFASASFDLVFCQLTLLWIRPLDAVAREVWRVLAPGGVWIALEPDYGGMIEHPPGCGGRELWRAALRRAGAEPSVGRQLPGVLAAEGFAVRVQLLETIQPPDSARWALLRGLPLTAEESEAVARLEAESPGVPWAQVVHLPFFLVAATRPLTGPQARL